MCCFTELVESVGDTSIFCRSAGGARQYLVYSMAYAAASEVAMVLPLAVPPGGAEDAVTFINLEAYPTFFTDLEWGFIPPRDPDDMSLGSDEESTPRKRLAVHDVGGFEASFVPRVEDFERLDPRFRLPPDAWDRLPGYSDYGFAVFKLKAASAARRVHPMALSFPRRDAGVIFFPAVHVHDREVHGAADFDHSLYLQVAGALPGDIQFEMSRGHSLHWSESYGAAGRFMNTDRSQALLDPHAACFRLHVQGRFQNQDIAIGPGGSFPQPIPGLEERRADGLGKAVFKPFEDLRAQALAQGARWLALDGNVRQPCRDEAEVAEVLRARPRARIFSTGITMHEQGLGLTRFHWQAGDRE